MIAIVRGGGSADDLAVFNDEFLAKRIASSRIPIITGIGHEVDESLADLSADVRAATPTNAAELLTPDKRSEIWRVYDNLSSLEKYLTQYLETLKETKSSALASVSREIDSRIDLKIGENLHKQTVLSSFDPEKILKQGYAILKGDLSTGNVVKITLAKKILEATINRVENRAKPKLL